MTESVKDQHFGFAVLLGAPNAGKSTLLNKLIGEKLSIVSAKANTTRMRVVGLLCEGDTQMGLIDTPGIFNGKTGGHKKMDSAMLQAAWSSLEDADAVLLIVDAGGWQPDTTTEAIIEGLKLRNKRAYLALNKTDKIAPEKLLPLAKSMDEKGIFDEIFMISALTGEGTEALRAKLFAKMPQGPWMFPEDQLSELPSRLLAAEVTREQLFLQLHAEVPYEAAVLPETWETKKDGSVVIHQTIVVTRPAHRMIILGKNGAQIKSIGQAARRELAQQFGHPVHLFLDVKVDERWAEKNEFYRMFGLDGS